MEHAGHNLSLVTNLLLLAGAFALSTVTYRLFENPIRRSTELRGAVGLALWPAAIATVLFVSSIGWSDYQDAANVASYTFAPQESLTEAPQTESVASGEAAQVGWRPSSPRALVTAVTAVQKGSPIPSPLTPSALALPSSEYSVPGQCIATRGELHSALCNLGDSAGKKTLVVVGDSHALMWMPTILSFARRAGYDVQPIMKYGCTVKDWAGPVRISECAAWYKRATLRARELHPALLIIAAHYNLVPFEGDIEYTGPTAIKTFSEFGAADRSSAHRIVVLGDPPGQEQEPTDCLLGSHPTMKTCSYNETAGQAETTAGLAAATKAFGVFLDSTPWFCYRTVCPMVIGHTVVNFNRSHMTTQYAEELAPLFSAAMERLLAQGTPVSGHAGA
jgi:hypothetical protein